MSTIVEPTFEKGTGGKVTSFSPKSLADQLVEKASAAVEISPKELFTRLEKDASLDAYANCLQPHEVENWKELASERIGHVQQCTFCQVLLREGTPLEEHARAYASEAVRIAEATPRVRFGAAVDFLMTPYKAVKALAGLFGPSEPKVKTVARSL